MKFFYILFRVRIWRYVTGFFPMIHLVSRGKTVWTRFQSTPAVMVRVPLTGEFHVFAALLFLLIRYFFFNSSYHTLFFSTILFFRFFMFAHLRILAYFIYLFMHVFLKWESILIVFVLLCRFFSEFIFQRIRKVLLQIHALSPYFVYV